MFTLANNNVLGARAVVARTRGGGGGNCAVRNMVERCVWGKGGGPGRGAGSKTGIFFLIRFESKQKKRE